MVTKTGIFNQNMIFSYAHLSVLCLNLTRPWAQLTNNKKMVNWACRNVKLQHEDCHNHVKMYPWPTNQKLRAFKVAAIVELKEIIYSFSLLEIVMVTKAWILILLTTPWLFLWYKQWGQNFKMFNFPYNNLVHSCNLRGEPCLLHRAHIS